MIYSSEWHFPYILYHRIDLINKRLLLSKIFPLACALTSHSDAKTFSTVKNLKGWMSIISSVMINHVKLY